MNISVIDGSNYFKGLLLLIRKDRKISDSEMTMMRRIGKELGFEKEFCEHAINDVLENEYIEDTPPIFTSKLLAEKFIKDGLKIAYSDHELHLSEESWLKIVAEQNGLDNDWFQIMRDKAALHQYHTGSIEAEDITVQYK